MCGLAGLISTAPETAESMRDEVSRMTHRLIHRGPDGTGVWVDSDAAVALGHRRLAILDVSERGHQPMVSASGRWVIAYNGEIYNFAALREELAALGQRFRGGSDTEVLLAAIEVWGLEQALIRANGMFAVALWDRQERRLHLARDRIGKKPLYYGWVGRRFAFASELEALRALPDFDAPLDRDALAAYFRFSATPGARSVHLGISKVEPGSIRSLTPACSRTPVLTRYWSAADVVGRALGRRSHDADVVVDELHALLHDSVRLRLESDVPLGAFLSGGIDSSLVVALMQSQITRRVRTFAIGFSARGWDEAPYARAVAEHLGTEHTELYVTPDDARAVIPKLASIYDEPFCDVSQIPTYLVSRLAREHVTVCLSGDGGDELFAGYARYAFFEAVRRAVHAIPRALRRPLAVRLRALRDSSRAMRGLSAIEPTPAGHLLNRDRLFLLEQLLDLEDPVQFYRCLIANWREPAPLVLGTTSECTPALEGLPTPWPALTRPGELASYVDLLTYLPDDILVKVDRASMAVSLEARAPLLDFRVAELAWRIPYELKTRNGEAKWPLKALLARYVPRGLTDRPKRGFGVPIGEWLRGPLRAWADDLLAPDKLRREGVLDIELVHRRWAEHRSGQRNWAPHIWSVLMFESWLGELMSRSRCTQAPARCGQVA